MCMRLVVCDGRRSGGVDRSGPRGGGATAASAGLLRQDFDGSFQGKAARMACEPPDISGRASGAPRSISRRRFDGWHPVRSRAPGPDSLHAREAPRPPGTETGYQARRDAGLDVSWLTAGALARETALDGNAAIRMKGDVFDPYRACVGLAAAAAARGALVHERTPVRRIRAGRKAVTIKTDTGLLTADAVVVATGAPIDDLRALRRHFVARETYMVLTETLPAAVRRQAGIRAASLLDVPATSASSFPHLLRWMKDDRVLFTGADQAPTPPRARSKTLTQRTGQLMYELSTLYPPVSGLQPEWAWDLVHHESADGLPIVGLHRNFPRHLFALGHGRHGAGVAWLAARLLLRQFLGEPGKGDELFGFSRIL